MQPIVLYRAIRTLMKNKEDTVQVFKAIEAAGSRDREKYFRRFAQSEAGERILSSRSDILSVLNDRARLAAMPEGSLGRRYYEFMSTQNITADGLLQASEESAPTRSRSEDMGLFSSRLRDTHDLWHVMTGYGRDGLGELCLLAFSYAQIRNRAIGLIVLAGSRRATSEFRRAGIWRAVREGHRRGRRASWLPEQEWEVLLPRPLDELRRELGLERPAAYRTALKTLAERGNEEARTAVAA